MKFVDFFAGIGGIRLGLEQAGHKCVGFCEWDKYARTAYKAMYNTEGEWEATMYEQLELMTYPTQTSGASASRAKTSASQASKKACRQASEADCFTRLCDCLPDVRKKIDLNGYSLKMLKIYLALETDLISRGCSLKWEGMGILSNGTLSTAKTTAFPKTGSACSLSAILETSVDEKYFLSDEQTARILANSRK